ncbi:HP5 [Drosophila busckii]|uniref:HP5 n=1 Tax=Drosophila busckii TaxID=30019 RepID=A0A0M4EY20_DROBS|nr:transcriptional regulator ATRX homolog [Drosophila busckii]ALC48792.1 HP5 [Drosophila busckii]
MSVEKLDPFDLMRAVLPPQHVRELEKEKARSPSPSSAQMSPLFSLEDDEDMDLPSGGSPQPLDKDKTSLDEKETETEDINYSPASQDADDPGVSPGLLDIDEQTQMSPPKTKAQQKMFDDISSSESPDDMSVPGCKRLLVRVKRCTEKEIERLTTPQRKAKKRGRQRISSDSESPIPSTCQSSKRRKLSSTPAPSKSQSSKRQKLSPAPTKKIRAKLGKERMAQQQDDREESPPESSVCLAKRKRSTSSTLLVDPALVERFGLRFFNCFVRMQRTKNHPTAILKRTNRKSKAKLSVSFSESVEILGSKNSPKKLATVPTRLQRVDATGNVLEDIDLQPHTASTSAAAKAASKATSRPRKRVRSPAPVNVGRRGSGRPKKSAKIQDTEADNDDEYIVPNEMPECKASGSSRRVATPVPLKRTVTTTVSDEEDATDNEQEKLKRDHEKELDDSNSEVVLAWLQEKGKQVTSQLEEKKEQMKVTMEQDKSQWGVKKSETEVVIKQKKDEPAEKAEDICAEQTESDGKDKEQEQEKESEEIMQQHDELTKPIATTSRGRVDDDIASEDILEIKTSVDDVRLLRQSCDSTPPNSGGSTPPTPEAERQKRYIRLTSHDSDSSFKSAHEMQIARATRALTPILRTASVEEIITPPVITATSASNIINRSEPSSSILQPHFAPIGGGGGGGVMPNLDDDLDDLDEQVFPLNNTRHRHPLDDFMTVLDRA